MSVLVFLLAFSLLGGDPSPGVGCGCRAVAPDQKPLGGNDNGIVETVEPPVRNIRGSVSVGGRPVDKAIVEVFDYPASEPSYWDAANAKRTVACMTGKHGSFCFTGLPPGRYLLRAGVSNHDLNVFNYYFVVVTVADKAGVPDKKMDIELVMAN
jgi:hypothetical protein